MRTTIFGEELMKAATDVELVIQYGEKQSNCARIWPHKFLSLAVFQFPPQI